MGWRPFGRVSRKLDELLIKTARETVGDDVELMVDAGGSEQFWPHGVSWARETARMLGDYGVVWFEEALRPDDVAGFNELRAASPVLDRHRRSAHAAAVVPAVYRPARGRHHSARLDQVRRFERGLAAGLAGVRVTACNWCRTAGTRRWAWRPIWRCRRRCRWLDGSSFKRACPTSKTLVTPRFELDAEGLLRVPTGPGLGIEWNPEALERYTKR